MTYLHSLSEQSASFVIFKYFTLIEFVILQQFPDDCFARSINLWKLNSWFSLTWWCTKQWQNAAQVLHNNRIKFFVVPYTKMAAVTSRKNREYCIPFFYFWRISQWALFTSLSKVISRLPFLRLVIGLKISCQFFNQWETKSKPLYTRLVILGETCFSTLSFQFHG